MKPSKTEQKIIDRNAQRDADRAKQIAAKLAREKAQDERDRRRG